MTEPTGKDGSPSREAGAEPEQHTFTVLYAEDNEINVMLVRNILALRPACRLLVARSGREAIDSVRRERPDLLLLDLHLGDMTGFEVGDALDRDPVTAGVPRVALSADAMPDQVREAKRRGFDDYITKPIDIAALLGCIDRLIEESAH